jgi:hypothetical protein
MVLGFRHIYFGLPAPLDQETIERLASDVRPRLEELSRSAREAATLL